MKVVRCHQFACVEPAIEERSRKPFRPRSSPLRLRECLTLETNVPRPTNDDEGFIIIQTCFAGIQYPDALQAQGLYQVHPPLPYVPGMDVVGYVVHVNNNNNKTTEDDAAVQFQPGDRVMATLLDHGGTGGLAEYVKVPSEQVYHLPNNVPMEACANLGRNYFAAYHSLVLNNHNHHNEEPSKNSGMTVLVTGASGGVGMATIELAKALGHTVIAGVSHMNKARGPQSVGADRVLVYGRGKTRADRKKLHRLFKQQVQHACQEMQQSSRSPFSVGVDLVVDMVHGDLMEDALLSVVRPLGTIAMVGFTAGQKPIRPGLVLVKEVNIVGSLWGRFAMENPKQHRANVQRILGFLEQGAIRPRVDRIIPIDNFVEAFEIFEENRGKGNTVVSLMEASSTNTVRSKL